MAHDDSTLLQELFSQAAERMAAGEPLEEIFASIPNEYFDELSDMLAVVEATLQLREAPVPQPSAVRRAQQRMAFQALAAEKRAEQAGAGQAGHSPVPARGRREELATMWEQVQALFTVRRLRLAPLLVLLLAIYLGASTLVAAAEEALPGDLTYPVKQWIRSQQVWLAPDTMRAQRVQELEQEAAEDVAKAAARADLNDLAVSATTYGTIQKIDHIRYKVGDLWVAPHYAPDANSRSSTPMQIHGEPEVGSFVRLDYQILPGQTNAGSEAMVLGISMTVIAPPPTAEPRPAVENDPSPPTVTPTATAACTERRPLHWQRHQVQPSETLENLAVRRGTSVERILEVNCVPNDAVIAGDIIYLPPMRSTPTATPPAGGGIELPPSATPLATDAGGGQEPTVAPTLAPTVEPTATPEEATSTVTPAPGTSEPDAGATSTTEPAATPTGTPSATEPSATDTPTVEPGASATAEPGTATPDAGAATPTQQPGGTETPGATPTSDGGAPGGDATATAEPTVAPTGQADTPTPEATATTAPATEPAPAPTADLPVPTATEPPATSAPEPVGGDAPEVRPIATEAPVRPTEPPPRPTELPPRPTEPPPTPTEESSGADGSSAPPDAEGAATGPADGGVTPAP